MEVDINAASRFMARALDNTSLAISTNQATVLSALLTRELLPRWDDEWLAPHRASWRMISIDGLETLADSLHSEGNYRSSLLLANQILHADSLREMAWRLLILNHLNQGHVGDAVRSYERCRNVFAKELGIGPPPLLEKLVVAALSRVSAPLGSAVGNGSGARK